MARHFAIGGLGERAVAWLADPAAVEVAVPRAASTVMLVRDDESGCGVEVFMLRRVASMAFAPRSWVFPGGGVDLRDDDPGMPWAGPAPEEWATWLGTDTGMARALVAAAVREVFEECGVLLAGQTADTVVADLRAPEWDDERRRLLSREQSLAELLGRRGLVLRSDLLSVQRRWVTPEFEPRRYDTWFFAALLPEGQIPDDETTESDVSQWTVPTRLLDDWAAGRALLLPPTQVALESVAEAESAATFIATLPPVLPVPQIVPQLMTVDGVPELRVDLL